MVGVGVGVEVGVEVDVGVGVGVVEVLGDAPTVPAGALPRATYPNRPDDALPQFSYGYPGQAWLQLPVEVVSAGT